MSNTQMIHFFSILNSNIAIKSFNLLHSGSQQLLTTQFENKTNLKSTNGTKLSVSTTAGILFFLSNCYII